RPACRTRQPAPPAGPVPAVHEFHPAGRATGVLCVRTAGDGRKLDDTAATVGGCRTVRYSISPLNQWPSGHMILALSSGPSVEFMMYRTSTSAGSPHRAAP